MNCEQFQQRLNEVLDERADPAGDSHLSGHAADCDDCRAALVGSRVLLRGLSRLRVPAVRADFSERVVAAAIAPASREPRSRLWLAGGVLLASAAAAMLAVSIVWYARRGAENVVSRPDKPTTELQPTGPRRGPRGFATLVPGKARRAPSPMAVTGGDLLIEAPRLPDHLRSYGGAIDSLALSLPQTAEQFNQMEQLAPGFRPLRISLALLWDTLCRTLPGAHSQEPPRSRTSFSPLDLLRLA